MTATDKPPVPMPIGSKICHANERFLLGTPLERDQALCNHGQTLERLAERGGLSWREAAAIVAGVARERIVKDDAKAEAYVRQRRTNIGSK